MTQTNGLTMTQFDHSNCSERIGHVGPDVFADPQGTEEFRLADSELGKPRHEHAPRSSCRWHEGRPGALKTATERPPDLAVGQQHRIQHVPLGTVDHRDWNYPIQLLGIQMLQAALAGDLMSNPRNTPAVPGVPGRTCPQGRTG